MAKVKYVTGDSGADEVEFRGYAFTDGKSTEIKDADLQHFQQGNPYFEIVGGKGSDNQIPNPAPAPAPVHVPEPQEPEPVDDDAPQGPFTVEDTGSGWYSILDKDGKQVGNKVRKDDAEAFEEMSNAEQLEYLS